MLALALCASFPRRDLYLPNAKRTYDLESTNALCTSDHKYALYVHILLRMGLRCSELCGLRWEDINLDEGTMHIKQALTTEGSQIFIGPPKSANSIRRLNIPEDLLVRLKKESKDKSGYIAMLNKHHITPNHFGDRQLEAFYNSMNVPKNKDYPLTSFGTPAVPCCTKRQKTSITYHVFSVIQIYQ